MEDEYIVEEVSEDDDYDSSSSDDDVQSFLKRECGLIEVEDDFEAEVDKVMTAHLEKLHPTANPPDNVHSQTDHSVEDEQEKINDELFYDPKMDDDDEKWVDDKRRAYVYPSTSKDSKQNLKPLPNSDAVLNCPACMTMLCMDCQRHAIYKNQYRAMFVDNCKVDMTEVLKYPKKKKFSKKKSRDVSVAEDKDSFHPVRCGVCNTEVAVYDSDEIYHFFNVLASY